MHTRDEPSTQCPVCLTSLRATANSSSTVGLPIYFYECPTCGRFAASYVDWYNLTSKRHRVEWQHVSALLREHTITGSRPILLLDRDPGDLGLPTSDAAPSVLPMRLQELLQRWPRTVPERIDRTLINFCRLSDHAGAAVTFHLADPVLGFANHEREFDFHVKALESRGHLFVAGSFATVTSSGWTKFDDLTRGQPSNEKPAFVAMWYGGDAQREAMDEAFNAGISPAIARAGYKANRADIAEHNEWIMDEVLGAIRQAPFVVADFTGHRNGVYFEAAFARGLGIPVVHTCRQDEFGNAHFDTQQLNHVLWDSPADLKERLYHRIVGSIGHGPLPT